MEPFEALAARLQSRRDLSPIEAIVNDDHTGVRNRAGKGLGVGGIRERDTIKTFAGVNHLRVAYAQAADDPHGVVFWHRRALSRRGSDHHASTLISAFARSSQKPMSISPYIVVAVVRCSRAGSRLPVRR